MYERFDLDKKKIKKRTHGRVNYDFHVNALNLNTS